MTIKTNEMKTRDLKQENLKQEKELAKDFVHHARKHARKLKRTFNDIVESSPSEAVHDFRRATRDLQTIVDVCGIHPQSRKADKLRRRLRKCRHALSGWRDSDVMLREIQKALRKSRTPGERQCWITVSKKSENSRRRSIEKFFRLAKPLGIADIASRTVAIAKKESRPDLITANLRLLLQGCWQRWNNAIDRYGRPASCSADKS
jgi:hypothetical protein